MALYIFTVQNIISTFVPLIMTIARAHLVTGSAAKEFPFP